MYDSTEFTDEYFMGEGDWLIGISNVCGVEQNYFTDDIMGMGGRHMSYELNGEVICQHVTASLGDEVAATALSVSVYGLAACVTGAEPGGEVRAYTADGSLVASANASANGSATITLPHSGLFLIATSSASAKVLVP